MHWDFGSLMKRCGKCKETKERELFGSNRSTRDGKNCYCKPCVVQISKERYGYHQQWRTENKDRWNAKSREWCEKNRDLRRAIVRKSDFKNREKRLEWKQQYYLENKEKCRQWSKNTSPELKAAIKARYLANKRKAFRLPYKRKEILEKAAFKCTYCGGHASGLDHVVPLSRGGHDTPENVVACCASCNPKKGNKLISEWKR